MTLINPIHYSIPWDGLNRFVVKNRILFESYNGVSFDLSVASKTKPGKANTIRVNFEPDNEIGIDHMKIFAGSRVFGTVVRLGLSLRKELGKLVIPQFDTSMVIKGNKFDILVPQDESEIVAQLAGHTFNAFCVALESFAQEGESVRETVNNMLLKRLPHLWN